MSSISLDRLDQQDYIQILGDSRQEPSTVEGSEWESWESLRRQVITVITVFCGLRRPQAVPTKAHLAADWKVIPEKVEL